MTKQTTTSETERSQTRIAILTSERAPDLTENGKELKEELERREMSAEAVVWNEDTDWTGYEVALLRSCWDYHTNPEKFRNLLRHLDENGVRVINPVDVVEWNTHKFYLRDLSEEGVEVLPTAWIEEPTDLENVLRENGWKEAVVKPAVGTSSKDVWRTSVEEASEYQERFENLVSADKDEDGDALVQEFAPEITEGEISFVFFEGEYSHSWRGYPEEGDFRTHSNYGGSSNLNYEAPSELVKEATEVLETATQMLGREKQDLTYARVDAIERKGKLCLMELELVEPYLHLEITENGPSKLADVVESELERGESGE